MNELEHIKDFVFSGNVELGFMLLEAMGGSAEKFIKDEFDELIKTSEVYYEHSIEGVKKLIENYEYTINGQKIYRLPKNLSRLPNLTDLGIFGNSNIPDEVFELDELKVLMLGSNELNEFPKKVLSMRNLSYLSLGDNNITSIPEEISEMQNLTGLDLSSNYNLKKIPESICKLQNLKSLFLFETEICIDDLNLLYRQFPGHCSIYC